MRVNPYSRTDLGTIVLNLVQVMLLNIYVFSIRCVYQPCVYSLIFRFKHYFIGDINVSASIIHAHLHVLCLHSPAIRMRDNP